MSKVTPSRRQVFCGLATAVLGGKLATAASGRRAVVAIRLSTTDTQEMLLARSPLAVISARSRVNLGLHPSLGEARRMFDSRSLAVLVEPGVGDTDRDFVAGGYSAPGWMMRAVGADVLHSEGKAFGLSSGLLLLTPSGVVGAESRTPVEFPSTAIGRQLRQAAGLIVGGAGPVQLFVASMSGTVAVGDREAQTAGILGQLAGAMAAFQRAMDQAGLASDVVAYTDPDKAGAGRVRLVSGGSVIGGEIYSMKREQSDAALAAWAGFGSGDGLAEGSRFIY